MPPLLWVLIQVARPAPDPARTPGCGRCGCAPNAHAHYRPGRDCGHCGPVICPAFLGRARSTVHLARAVLRLLTSR